MTIFFPQVIFFIFPDFPSNHLFLTEGILFATISPITRHYPNQGSAKAPK
jgi:hypothetical protein